jgi:alpha-glucosidase
MTHQQSNQNLLWWQRGVVYQIYPRSFMDTIGNGVGDLQGVIEKLDYLNDGDPDSDTSLGVDAIWLSPFYPSPMADFGYDVADYCDINTLFGSLDTFDLLVSEAHRRGIKIIIDYVPNHSSDQHRWFVESRSSRDSDKRDWYIWRDPKADGSLPNNWGSVFGGPAWTWDETTGQYYFHQFLKEQPDLNWRNPELRQAMFDVLRFWLDRGVDGFRMDVVGMIMKDPEMRDNPPDPNADPNLPENDLHRRNLHVYNEDQEEVHQILKEFRKILDQYGDRCAIGEIWYKLPSWVKYFGKNGDGLHLPFNFRLLELAWDAVAFRRSVDELDAAVPSFGWPNYVLGNHDRRRLASRIGLSQARVAAMLLLTLRGTPTLYYGDELGLENGIITADIVQDPQGHNLGLKNTRDQERTPMQWNSQPSAGFSTGEPWLPVGPDYEVRNVAVQNDDPASMLNLYRQLLMVRRNSPALVGGTYRSLDVEHEDCFVYLREHPEGSRLIALNFTDQPRILSAPYGELGEVALSTFLDRTGKVSLSELSLRPHEGIIVEVSL